MAIYLFKRYLKEYYKEKRFSDEVQECLFVIKREK
jgi:hypothetical protein